jgi:hypothetical protein
MSLFNLKNILLFLCLSSVLLLNQSCAKSSKSLTVNAGVDQHLYENIRVWARGTYKNNGEIKSFTWRQTSGISVKILSPQTNTLIFITPELPEEETELALIFDFIVTDSNKSKASDSITIFIKREQSPPIANAGENQTVESLATVNLTGTVGENGSIITTTLWQQNSGPEIFISEPSTPSISFTAPEVNTVTTIVLSYTVSSNDGLFSSDDIEIIVTPKSSQISSHILLFTQERIAKIKDKIAEDSTAWDAMTSKISHYYEKVPYNAGEYAGAFALAYYVSGEKKYIDRAIELLNHAYFDEPDIGWEYYSSRNLFRTNARWAVMGYSWIKDYISIEEQVRIENILKLWSEFWLKHVDFENDFKALRSADTDDVTSITKNLTLLGYVLSYSDTHAAFGEKVLLAGDTLLQRYVIDYYMKDIMKGGAWAEGSDYSPATQGHWIETFIINKDQRGIAYPTNYAKLAMESLLHQTLAGGTGVYKYGSEEVAVDYDELSGDYRYEFALGLMSILEDENDLALIHQWFNKIIDNKGFKSGSMVTHLDRLLYHDPEISTILPIENLNTLHYSEGVGLIASRDNWEDTATNLYFINRQIRVDHEHKDALSFDIAHNGVWITKEATGYGGVSESSPAHNTILIENAGDGSSSPTRRPAGAPKYNSIYNDDYVTLISADATKTYNMSGYFATDYALQVNRQLAFIKPNIVVVYDHIITDENKIRDLTYYSDLNLSEGMTHTRWVKLIQHTQAEPSFIEDSLNTYQVDSENRRLIYQVISPINATVNIINEKELWKDSLEYQVPENQRKWHFEVSIPTPKQDNEFITTLSFGESDIVSTDQLILAPIVMTNENSYIVSGNITGLAIQAQQNKYIILFNKNPEDAIENVEIKRPEGFDNAIVYGIGFEIN